MSSKRTVLLVLLLAACSAQPPAKELKVSVEQRNAELVQKHTEIWNLMGLSDHAKAELNGLVVAINTQMDTNRREKPDAYAEAATVQRAPGEQTHDEYIANHRKRFDALGISQPTQAELLGAAEFVWSALHDPAVPASQRVTAEKVQAMMKALNGPPPCCDDNIFRRAAP